MSVIRRHLWITGRVQGVFFRQSTWQQAQKIGQLQGWVRNLRDGRVEVLVQGPEASVQTLVDYCHHGPISARVDHVEQHQEPVDGELGAFDIT